MYPFIAFNSDFYTGILILPAYHRPAVDYYSAKVRLRSVTSSPGLTVASGNLPCHASVFHSPDLSSCRLLPWKCPEITPRRS